MCGRFNDTASARWNKSQDLSVVLLTEIVLVGEDGIALQKFEKHAHSEALEQRH